MSHGNSLLLSRIFGVLLLTLYGTAQSDIPKVISYQGKATDSSGTPVDDGLYPMRFWIYDAATGGTNLWDSGAQSVAVNGGVFNVLLGESPQPMIDLDFGQDYWLLVRFNGVDQTPRQRLASIGYSYMASGLVPGTEVVGSVTSGTLSALKGTNLATSGTTYGGSFVSFSPSGTGVYGAHDATTGTDAGVLGVTGSISSSAAGVVGRVESYTPGVYSSGVRGINNGIGGSGIGVYGSQDGSGWGVYGTAPSGTGVRGYSTTGTGVEGSGRIYGVYGTNPATDGRGVYGYATGATGYTYGVYGRSDSWMGFGVYGYHNGSGNIGRLGSSSHGVYGFSTSDDLFNAAGVWGEDLSGDGVGVRGQKEGTQGIAVYGINAGDTGSGVAGESVNYYGVAGLSYNYFGVAGYTELASNNYGLYTPDNLYSLNYHTAGAVMHVARNGGSESLEPNDVVVFTGIAPPPNAGGPPVVEVAKATSANSTAVAGVVYSRFDIEAVTQTTHPLTGEGFKPGLEVTPDGPVPFGEYLLLVVQGPAQVKASALSGSIRTGDLLGSAPRGFAGKAIELTFEGPKTAMPGSVLGKALESLEGDQGVIYAFVTLQ